MISFRDILLTISKPQWPLAVAAISLLAVFYFRQPAATEAPNPAPADRIEQVKPKDPDPVAGSAGIRILMPVELETTEITEVSPQTWHLKLTGKALGSTPVEHILINGREASLNSETREFSADTHLDYGINSITLLLLGSDRRWSHRTWKVIRRPLIDEIWSDTVRGQVDPYAQTVKDKIRSQINELIQNFDRPATLGLFREAVSLTISYGAPAYNQGDRAGCYEFYQETAQSLCQHFLDKKAITIAGQSALSRLDLALKRCEIFPSADRKAWTLRFAFDQIISMWNTRYASLRELMQMGHQYAQSGWYEEAQEALSESVELVQELTVVHGGTANIEPQYRAAPLALASVWYAQRKFPEAGRIIAGSLSLLPELTKLNVNRRTFCIRGDHYDLALRDLEFAAGQNESDADLQFLLGYEYYLLGKKLEASRQFGKVLKLMPQHAGAKLFLLWK